MMVASFPRNRGRGPGRGRPSTPKTYTFFKYKYKYANTKYSKAQYKYTHTNIGAGCGYNYKCSCGHSTPSTASTCPPTIDALKDDVFLKPIIAPTIAENITLMRLSYTHFSRLDTLTDVSKKAIKICYRFRGTPQLQTNVFP